MASGWLACCSRLSVSPGPADPDPRRVGATCGNRRTSYRRSEEGERQLSVDAFARILAEMDDEDD